MCVCACGCGWVWVWVWVWVCVHTSVFEPLRLPHAHTHAQNHNSIPTPTAPSPLGLYTILPSPILFGIYFHKGGRVEAIYCAIAWAIKGGQVECLNKEGVFTE